MKNENQNGNQTRNAKTSQSGKCCNNSRQKAQNSQNGGKQKPESCK